MCGQDKSLPLKKVSSVFDREFICCVYVSVITVYIYASDSKRNRKLGMEEGREGREGGETDGRGRRWRSTKEEGG